MKVAAIIESLANGDDTMKNFYQDLYKKMSKISKSGDEVRDKNLMMQEMYKQPPKSAKELIIPNGESKAKDKKEVRESVLDLIQQNKLKRDSLIAKEVLSDIEVKRIR